MLAGCLSSAVLMPLKKTLIWDEIWVGVGAASQLWQEKAADIFHELSENT